MISDPLETLCKSPDFRFGNENHAILSFLGDNNEPLHKKTLPSEYTLAAEYFGYTAMSFQDSARYRKCSQLMHEQHLQDPQKTENTTKSAIYHSNLHKWAKTLAAAADLPPSEALLLSAQSQHIRRWELQRSSYPDGLVGYKRWRTTLLQFHSAAARNLMSQAGYHNSPDQDEELYNRVTDLLTKRTLKGGQDEEMQLFEDAVCLTFLELEFAEFITQHDEAKVISVVQKTWAKMGQLGRDAAVDTLAASLSPECQAILTKALAEA